MDIWTDEMTGLVVSTAVSILAPYLVYALERYLKIRLDAAARETLDSAMRDGADWLIRKERKGAQLSNYARCAVLARVNKRSRRSGRRQ